ncbi:MAG: Gx transporter family protein [Oscillospiraceae bacterium]|nr:Gx transporter family protein [Oscillospiraceae bacterium]
MVSRKWSAQEITRIALLFALAIALSYLETTIPAVIPIAPGIKLGLSNIVTMFCLYSVNPGAAFLVAALKGGFAFLTRGFVAGVLSLSGGIFSVLILWLCSRTKMSLGMRSVCGAVSHNLAQLVVEFFMIRNRAVLAFTPALILGGIVCGSITAVLLKYLLPVIQKSVFTKKS